MDKGPSSLVELRRPRDIKMLRFQDVKTCVLLRTLSLLSQPFGARSDFWTAALKDLIILRRFLFLTRDEEMVLFSGIDTCVIA